MIDVTANSCKKAEMLGGRSQIIKASLEQEISPVQHYLHELRVAYLQIR